jgi:hypothetical protein
MRVDRRPPVARFARAFLWLCPLNFTHELLLTSETNHGKWALVLLASHRQLPGGSSPRPPFARFARHAVTGTSP